MREFLFAPRFNFVSLGAFMWLGIYLERNPSPAWVGFLLGGALGALNIIMTKRGE